MSPQAFRVINTGVRDGRSNVAIDQAIIDARKADLIPNTIRFLRFHPSVLIGRHQCLSQEVDTAFCEEEGIEIGRRVTGGGAIYLDEDQLGWELIFDKKSLGLASLSDITKEICEAAAAGLRRLGIDAAFRPRNDIEVDGRKLSGTGGFFDGTTIFYQGTLLFDLNDRTMSRALKIPREKLLRHDAVTPGVRMVTLRELSGGNSPPFDVVQNTLLEGFRERLAIAPFEGELSPKEIQLGKALYEDEIGTESFVREIDDPSVTEGFRNAVLATAGGTISVFLKLSPAPDRRIKTLLLTGDFFATPPRVIPDLEAYLKDVRIEDISSRVAKFFANSDIDLLSTTPAHITTAIQSAVDIE